MKKHYTLLPLWAAEVNREWRETRSFSARVQRARLFGGRRLSSEFERRDPRGNPEAKTNADNREGNAL
jgi:hypothetical protein